jgi:hypothetical protein
MASARGVSCCPSLVSADPLRPLRPHGDPFREPGQVGPGGDAQGRLERSPRSPAVSRILVVEAENHPGPFGEQVASVAGNLPELGDRRVDVERVAARLTRGGAGDPGACYAVRVRFAAGDGHAWTVPLIERTF